MDHDLKLATIDKMLEYGGTFAKRLALAWLHADARNAYLIEKAFAELLAKYTPKP